MEVNKETTRKCGFLSLKHGKKYILGIIVTKALIIWFIYTRSNDFLPLPPISFPVEEKTVNLTLYNITIFHIPLTDQKNVLPFYIEVTSDEWCFINGINLKSSRSKKKCKCLQNWFGTDCGIPEAIWKSNYLQNVQTGGIEIRRRTRPRRIISSVLFLGEFTLLDIIVHDSYRAIDLFLVPEEAFEKSPPLLESLKNGFLLEFQNRILPLKVKNVSGLVQNVKKWGIQTFENLWVEGWQHVADFRPDDIFLFSHVSSVISKDVLMFLKLYDGFPEPFLFNLKPLLYNFQHLITNISFVDGVKLFQPFGCTFEYFNVICNYNIKNILNGKCSADKSVKDNFEKNFWKLNLWTIGSDIYPAGWQCNWCITRLELENMFGSHIFQNFNTTYFHLNGNISSIVLFSNLKSGHWFNGAKTDFKILSRSEMNLAPDIVFSDKEKYPFLIDKQIHSR